MWKDLLRDGLVERAKSRALRTHSRPGHILIYCRSFPVPGPRKRPFNFRRGGGLNGLQGAYMHTARTPRAITETGAFLRRRPPIPRARLQSGAIFIGQGKKFARQPGPRPMGRVVVVAHFHAPTPAPSP